MKERLLAWLGLGLSLGVPAWLVIEAEALLAEGSPVLLDLAPRDPRSLMQGDYMGLRYSIAREARDDARHEHWPTDGSLVIVLDDANVATLVRRHRGGALGEDELLLRYRLRDDGIRLGAESYFFQEGTSKIYESARYGELRVAPNGKALLVGLRDGAYGKLGPETVDPQK